MKKRLFLGLACTLMLGVGGCMSEKKVETSNVEIEEGSIDKLSKEDSKLIERMLNYVNEKYGEDFKAYKFFPSSKGLTSEQSQSVLLAENSGNFKINIAQTNEEEGVYIENYKQKVFAEYVKKELLQYKNFDGDFAVSVILPEVNEVSEIDMQNNLTDLLGQASSFRISVFVEDEFSESKLKSIYEFYQNVEKYNPVKIYFTAASTIDKTATLEYLSQDQYYKNQYLWEDFDSSITEILWVRNYEETTFEKFISYVEKVGE